MEKESSVLGIIPRPYLCNIKVGQTSRLLCGETMRTATISLAGWGRYKTCLCHASRPERYLQLAQIEGVRIARGQGRSYGDASILSGGIVVLTERINRFLHFDSVHGIVRAEAGLSLAELLHVIVPKGWFLPVTPGTQYASLGGCIAADVHGKNHHHDGSFGEYVTDIELILTNGNRMHCSPEDNADIFWATVGGMGLTGIIGEVTLKLIPIQTAQMIVQHRKAHNIDAAFTLFENPNFDDKYSVAWIDGLARGKSLGRSIVMRGHHANVNDLPMKIGERPYHSSKVHQLNMPFNLPTWLLNPLTIRAFNDYFFRSNGNHENAFIQGYEKYFYPLDAINNWNRMYGKTGFVQYQCVLPDTQSFEGMKKLIEILALSGRPSFFAVLKRLGRASKGYLSFPLAGYTLALDIPAKKPEELRSLLAHLDETVLHHNGRVYLAKDAHLTSESFRAMYPGYGKWFDVKKRVDPENKFTSMLAQRLRISEP